MRRPPRALPPSRWPPRCWRTRRRRRSAASCRRRRAPRVPGVYPPRVYKPQLYAPDVQLGPGGVNVRMPQFRGPQVAGPSMGGVNAGGMVRNKVGTPNLKNLRGGGQPAQTGPLLPTQGLFRQRPWLPWWLLPLLLLLLLLLFLLYKFVLPHNVVVPNVVGKPSAFEAEETLTKSDLVLDAEPEDQDRRQGRGRHRRRADAEEGHRGREGRQGHDPGLGQVSGKVTVPAIVGQTASRRRPDAAQGAADARAVRAAQRRSGRQDRLPDPGRGRGRPSRARRSTSSSPTRRSRRPRRRPKRKPRRRRKAAPAGPVARAAMAAAAAGEIRVPAIGKQDTKTYAKAAADIGIVPVTKNVFSDKPVGTLFDTSPPGGTLVKPKSKVTAARLDRASPTWSSPTARTSCASTARRARSSIRWPRPRPRRRTRRGAPTAPTSPTRPTGS